MDTDPIWQLIPDYVLGLLPDDKQHQVEQHARHCSACREAIRRERQIETLLRQTVQVAARPTPGQLARLRPTPPRRIDLFRERLYRQLAPLTMIALLAVLGLLVQTGGLRTFEPAFAQTAGAPTQAMTSTHTPTATLAAADATIETGAAPATLSPAQNRAPAPETPPPGAPRPEATPIITISR